MQKHTSNAIERLSAVAHIARPESVVVLAAAVRDAREMLRGERIDGLRERVSDGGYIVSSKDLARGVLSNEVQVKNWRKHPRFPGA